MSKLQNKTGERLKIVIVNPLWEMINRNNVRTMRKKILKNVTEVQFDNCLFLSELPLKKQPTQRNMSYKAVTD